MELAPDENVQVGTFLNEIANVAEFIAKMMSDNENLKTKVEEQMNENENLITKLAAVNNEKEHLKTLVGDLTIQNKVLNQQVVDLTGENQKLFQEKEEEIFKRKGTEEELKFEITKNTEQKRENDLKNMDKINQVLEINGGLKNKGREIVFKAKQYIKHVSEENTLLTIENELFKKFEEKRTNDGKSILEDLARLKQMTTQFSFYRKRASKRELFNRISYHVKESMIGCIE